MKAKFNKLMTWVMTAVLLAGSVLLLLKETVTSRADSGQNVTAYMNIRIKELYYLVDIKGESSFYRFIKNGEVVERYEDSKGNKIENYKSGAPEFAEHQRFFLEYAWNVKKEDMHHIRKGNYFEVPLTDKSAFQFSDITKQGFKVPVKGVDTEFGSVSLNAKDHVLRVSFDQENAVYEEAAKNDGTIDNGFVYANAKMITTEENKEIVIGDIIKNGAVVEYKITPSKIKKLGPIGAPANPGEFTKHGDWQGNPRSLHYIDDNGEKKEGKFDNHILWYFRVNRKALEDMYKNAKRNEANEFKPVPKNHVMLIDKLPSIYDVIDGTYLVYVDFLPPTLDGDGNVAIQDGKASIANRTYYKFFYNGENPSSTGNILELELVKGENLEDLKTKLAEKRKTTMLPLIGFCNNSTVSDEKDIVIMDFGELPSKVLKYTYVYATKEELKTLVDTRVKIVELQKKNENDPQIQVLENSIAELEKNCQDRFSEDLDKKTKDFTQFVDRGNLEVTPEQKDYMWEFYKDRFVTDFVVSFRAKPISVINNATFPNEAEMHYNNTKVVKAKSHSKSALVGAGADQSVGYQVTVSKQWLGADGSSIEAPSNSESVEITLYKTVKDKKTEVKTVSLNKDNGWSHEFKNLAKFEGEDPIIYDVQEKEVPGYVSLAEGSVYSGKLTIKNRVKALPVTEDNNKQPESTTTEPTTEPTEKTEANIVEPSTTNPTETATTSQTPTEKAETPSDPMNHEEANADSEEENQTEEMPERPDTDVEEPEYPTYDISSFPDPRDPESPETIIIISEDGSPKVYNKVINEQQEFVYVDDSGVPLIRGGLPKAGDRLTDGLLNPLVIGIVPVAWYLFRQYSAKNRKKR